MYLSIILLPLLGSIISGFLGRVTGIYGSRIISSLSIVITTLLSAFAFFEIGLNNNPISITLFEWLATETINIVWSFQFDSLTVSMLIPVLIISSLVHIYSVGYMSNDPHSQRFFSYLSLFTFMMIILVTADNYLLMFVGWEGVGVCSYLLVNFWFTRIAANQSSISAFLTNRVGDCFLTLGIFGLLWCLGNVEYNTIFSLGSYINTTIVSVIGLFLLIGAMAKSSQIGLHIWLPMAMEGFLSRALLKLHYMRESPVFNSWSSIYLINFGKIQEEGKSAGNLLIKDSSETTCEAIFNNNFKWWFIGFTEGDGSFILNKNGYLEFKVTQSSVDAQILFYIKKELGFGSVSIQDKINKTHHFRVRDKKNILKIIKIFNGNILTKYKLNQFKLWIEGFNKIYNMDVKFIEPIHKINLNNAWLSGFTDAEGCFTSSVLTSKEGKNIVTVRYIISQKDDKNFSENLAILLNGYVTYVKSYNGYNTIVNFSKLGKILNYLKNYPLKTKKLISYRRWLKIYYLVNDKKHFTPEGLTIIKFLTKIINN